MRSLHVMTVFYAESPYIFRITSRCVLIAFFILPTFLSLCGNAQDTVQRNGWGCFQASLFPPAFFDRAM